MADAGATPEPQPEAVSEVLLALYEGRPADAERLAATRAMDVFEAAALGRAERVRELCARDRGAAGAWSPDGFTALHLAAFFAHAEAVRVLLAEGADVTAAARNAMRVLPLHSASVRRGTEIPRLLLDAGAPVDARQRGGFTALHAAAQNGDEELVELLLERGADASLATDEGHDAAWFAEEQGHAALAARLRATSGAGP